jgi:hypothetical protein
LGVVWRKDALVSSVLLSTSTTSIQPRWAQADNACIHQGRSA